MKKVILKVELHDDKIKQKAMKTVSGLTGVESISMDMKDKKLTVTGDIDPVKVVAKLRKLCHTDIVSVGPAKEPEKKKEEPKKEENKKDGGGDKNKKEEMMKAAYLQHQAYLQQHQYPHYHQYAPPHVAAAAYPAYSRTVEEDPNACVIC